LLGGETAYMMLELYGTLRRIFTGGRKFQKNFELSLAGSSMRETMARRKGA